MNATNTVLHDIDLAWRDVALWFAQHSAQILVASLIGLLVATGLCAIKYSGNRMARDAAVSGYWQRTFGTALSKVRWWFIAAAFLRVVSGFAHAPADIASIVSFLFVIAATLQAAILFREVAIGMIEYRATGHEGLGNALGIIRVLISFAVFAIALVLILSNLGVNVTGLLAGLGIGGIAIGLAAQGIFKDLFAAFSIVLDRPFSIGDLIKFGDITGRVEKIGLKTTRIRSIDGEEVIIGNDRLLDQQLRNFHAIESRRILITLPVHYANDPAILSAIPIALKDRLSKIAKCHFDHAFLYEAREAALMLEILVHAASGEAAVRDQVRHDVIVTTLLSLREAGVQLLHQPA